MTLALAICLAAIWVLTAWHLGKASAFLEASRIVRRPGYLPPPKARR